MRFIADMTNNICYTILSSGISGDAVNPFYADQTQL
jgi:acyl-homoserine lactone acylase PvdQ